MAVSRKGRRKISVDGAEYVWWIVPQYDEWGDALHVVGEARELHLVYALEQSDERRFVTVLGRAFRGHARFGDVHRRFRCAAVGQPGLVKPSDVAALIR